MGPGSVVGAFVGMENSDFLTVCKNLDKKVTTELCSQYATGKDNDSFGPNCIWCSLFSMFIKRLEKFILHQMSHDLQKLGM